MAVRQLVGGDYLQWTTGASGLATLANGAYTVAAICRRFSHDDMAALLSLNSDVSGINMVRWDEFDEIAALHSGNEAASSGISWTEADSWALIAVTKAAGTAVVRGHRILLGGAATHQDSAGTIDANATNCDIAETRWNSDEDFAFRGRIAVMGAWSSVLGDATLEGLVDLYSDWVAASPLALWRFDQASQTEAVDDQVGDADQTDRVGTTVITDDDPPGFSFVDVSVVGYKLDAITGPALARTITGPGV